MDRQGTVLADLARAGQKVTVLRGGRGGRGNAAFVSATNRAPTICEQGEHGPEGWFTLELKLHADAALIGFPNAGKSTLISRVSAARPKVADYPFTTLEPHLGVVKAGDRDFVLADIPGLVEGAAGGKGLGHEFLRHVERARVLVILLDPSPWQEHPPLRQLEILLGELRSHLPELVDRPRLVAVNKADLPEAAAAASGIEGALLVSALTGQGVDALVHRVADLVQASARHPEERPGFVLHRPAEPAFTIRRQDRRWLVEGLSAQRAVAFADLTLPEARDRAARNLARLGVDRALAEAGAQPGDEVQIGDLIFEYTPFDEDRE
jgi:GTP-binding protein